MCYINYYYETIYPETHYFKDLSKLDIITYYELGGDILTEFKHRVNNLIEMKLYESPQFEEEYKDTIKEYHEIEHYLRHIEFHKAQYGHLKYYNWCLELLPILNNMYKKIEPLTN